MTVAQDTALAPPAPVDPRPGLNAPRLAALSRDAVRRVGLDLTGRSVVTEAATGAYAVTAVLAVLAGARRVRALAGDSPYGTAAEAIAYTQRVAAAARVQRDIEYVRSRRDAGLADADIVTNSGHLRPLDAPAVARMKPGAAIPLMYEAWELRPGDVDVAACRRHGIKVAGTNECHPAVDVLSFLGVMVVKLLADAGVAAYRTRLLLLCDNPFRPFLERGLRAAGAVIEVRTQLSEGPIDERWDAVVVALRPRARPVFTASDVWALGERAPGTVVAQLWGDLDRDAADAVGVPVWPAAPPRPGHMGILPSAVGPEPVVRLQAAGLKVGSVLCKEERWRTVADLDYVQAV